MNKVHWQACSAIAFEEQLALGSSLLSMEQGSHDLQQRSAG
jgi:hypothetical protein